MTIKQAAEALGLQVRTIREWIKTGRLPATKGNDGRWYIDESVIKSEEVQARADKGREHSRRLKKCFQLGMLAGGGEDSEESV